MRCKVLSTVKKYNMLQSGDKVIVALSGGADSMSLFSILCSLKDELDISVSAAHVNHGLRGEESDGDESFVREVCRSAGVKLHVLETDIAAECKKTGEGTEECGRRIRYEFFNSIDKSAKIATAHTLSDNLETMLLNLTRGAALNGLCGIPPVRDNLIRPLIECTRDEIEDYCGENGILYVTDSTNSDSKYSRNRIRNLVIPQLKVINPSIEAASRRCTEILAEDENFLCECAEKLLEDSKSGDDIYDAEAFTASHPSIRKRAILKLLKSKMTEKPQKHHVDIIDGLLLSGGSLQTAENVILTVKNGKLFFENTDKPIEPWISVPDGNLTRLPFGTAKFKIITKKNLIKIQKIHKDILAFCLDYDKITSNVFFRSRLDGDKIRQAGGNCTKTLKKLFNEKHIPVQKRNEIVLLADSDGVLWVENYGCDERVKITDSTENVILIEIKRF